MTLETRVIWWDRPGGARAGIRTLTDSRHSGTSRAPFVSRTLDPSGERNAKQRPTEGAMDQADRATTAYPEAGPPRSFLGSLPWLWSHVLFPGKANAPGPWRWGPFLSLLVLPALLLYPCLSFYLFEPDEGRYAQIPREMLERGEW